MTDIRLKHVERNTKRREIFTEMNENILINLVQLPLDGPDVPDVLMINAGSLIPSTSTGL